MIQINIPIKLYQLAELESEAKEIAVAEHREFLVSVYSDDMYDESFEMTQWKYEKALTEDEVIESIDINDYLFYADGDMAHTVQFTGKHPRSGERILKHKGEEYSIA